MLRNGQLSMKIKLTLVMNLRVLDKNLTLADLINRYLLEITPLKKGRHMESITTEKTT